MAITLNHFDSKIEDIKNDFARREGVATERKFESFSKDIVAAAMKDESAKYQAEIANIAGSERMTNYGTQITGASNNASLLNLVSEFNRFFTQGSNTPAQKSPSR